MRKGIGLLVMVTAIAVALGGCDWKREVVISGRTMGTLYQVKVVAPYLHSTQRLKTRITDRLEEINQSMSTFLPASEISQFNSARQTGKIRYVSDDFLKVMAVAENLYQLTGGAWDGTVKPLVELWGFGGAQGPHRVPSAEAIAKTMAHVGFDKIGISENRYLVKEDPQVTLDLASIAKGYAVDQLAELIRRSGYTDFLVEIGGEVFASGTRPDGGAWRVGINVPLPGAAFNEVYQVVPLKDRAFATSGDYRNFFEMDGRRYSHVIDPRTGYPVANGVVSVSIVADSCTFADGFATALMVMGPEQGVALADRLPNLECLIVVETPDGTLTDYASRGFTVEE